MEKQTISVIGRGLNPRKHLTLDAISSLQSSQAIFGAETNLTTWGELSAEFNFPQIEDISGLYHHGAKDIDNYMRFIDFAMEQMKQMNAISLVVAGHPRLGVSFIKLLKERCLAGNIQLRVIESVSSFDVMINDLEFDPIDRGSAILDANRILLFDYVIEPACGCWIYHVCSVGTTQTNYLEPQKENSLESLQRHLERFYKPTTNIYLCKAGGTDDSKGIYRELKLSELTDNLPKIDFGTTLFIPPQQPKRLNQEFLNRLGLSL
jgi:uncharacterized protein YabN with tetrapyrrole methylase and pyrophosphatase domain